MSVQRVVTGKEGCRVVWRECGSGKPLLLLHGGYGSWNHWAANVDGLSARRRVLVPDIPGLGESDDPADLTSLISIAEPLRDGLDALLGDDASFDVAAFSFGGSVAGAIGLRNPGRIGHLVLVGAGGLKAPRPPSVTLESWRDVPEGEERLAIHRRNLERFMFADARLVDREAVEMQAWNTSLARVKSRSLSRQGLLLEYLPQHAGPIDGIWGTRDATAEGYLEERRSILRSADPESCLAELDGVGHWAMREAPDATNREILRFIARSDG